MFELISGTAVVNSWIVYNIISNPKLTTTEFRRQLAEELATNIAQNPKQQALVKKRKHTFKQPEGPGQKTDSLAAENHVESRNRSKISSYYQLL